MITIRLLLVFIFFITPNMALAATGAPTINGEDLSIIWGLPFAGMLLSIALFPLLAGHFWHHNFGKIALFWTVIFVVPFTVYAGFAVSLYEILHVILLEYIPFFILLFALFTVAGGICIKGKIVGNPYVNIGFLSFGAGIASFMGTTGASMLLIRPVIRANRWRIHRKHVIIFFIFLVANIGGSLSPLGDPPLFLGFLQGVGFFWPLVNMISPMLIISSILLLLFFVIDVYYYRREGVIENLEDTSEPIGLVGWYNVALLLCVVLSVLISGFWKPNITFTIYYIPLELSNIVRDVSLLAIALLSWKITPKYNYDSNGFTWFPIQEIGKLFIAIFITIIPVIAMLKAGGDGDLSTIIHMVIDDNNQPINSAYFWITGLLSGFLDNAPTYLIFFNTAGGDATILTTTLNTTLLAISMGAVFMGAITYIGNAPNFMVRSIAEEQGIEMPSFFGYMGWSIIILLPCFVILDYIYF